jgi:uncharacterized protein (UPF0147 family)
MKKPRAAFTCKIDETQQGASEDSEALDRFLEPKDDFMGTMALNNASYAVAQVGIRTLLWSSYEIPRMFYACDGFPNITAGSAPQRIRDLGCLIYYSCEEQPRTGRKKRPSMDVDELVKRWHETIVGLAMAHDKDGVDRYESAVEECLSPILTAPVKQLREFGPKLLKSLKADTSVPYLIWRAYEVWIDQMDKATDEDIVTLKKDLAADIVKMVEEDAKAQLPDAMVRALMWRSPDTLEKVKEVVTEEKAAGRSVRIKGRESCLFLEAGGTEAHPKVCVQI